MGEWKTEEESVYKELYDSLNVGDLVHVEAYKNSPWAVITGKVWSDWMAYHSFVYMNLDGITQEMDLFEFNLKAKKVTQNDLDSNS